MNDDELLIEDNPRGCEGVRLLTLHRPKRKNTLNQALLAALSSALGEADQARSVRALVLTGAGDCFCAGGDLREGLQGGGFLEAHLARKSYADLLHTMRFLRTPTVVAVNGHALGGGLGLVLSADLAVAADGATLGTPEVKRGLFPMMISRLIYEQLPRKAANALVLLGERVNAQRAVELGIVNDSVPEAEVLDAALQYAVRMSAMSPAALGLGRHAVNVQMDMPFGAALDHLADQLTLNLQTDDAAEGIAAFLEKRDPNWKGG